MADESDNLHSPVPDSNPGDHPSPQRVAVQPPQTAALPMAQPVAPLPPPGRKRKWLVLALFLLFVAIFFAERRGENPASKAAPPPPPVAISTATAKKGDIGNYVNALGTVTPVYTVSITSRVLGQILSVNYREGQRVHKGELLLQIDPRPYDAQLTQYEGQLAHDQALLAEARIDMNRYQAAFERNAIAQQQLQDQQQLVAQDEGTVKNDEGLVENARLNVQYTRITSPIDGRVGLRLVDPGNLVQATGNQTLLVITQMQPITVIFAVAEGYVPQIQQQFGKGRQMEVIALDRTQQHTLATGSLQSIDNQIDPTTGTLKLRAIFANQDEILFPNEFVNARLLLNTERGVVLIPNPTIQRNAQGAFVYLVRPDNTIEMRSITTGTTDNTVTAVTGLQRGDVVAADNFDKLQQGAKVERRAASPASSAGTAPNGGGNGANGTAPSGVPGSAAGSAPGGVNPAVRMNRGGGNVDRGASRNSGGPGSNR